MTLFSAARTGIVTGTLALLAVSASACESVLRGEGVHRAEGAGYVVAWRPVPAPLRVSEFFAMEIATCAKAGGRPPPELRVDAVMPEHRHGMNYRPTVAALGDGRFRAEGMLLHMPGLWELKFEVRGTGKDETVRERVVVQ